MAITQDEIKKIARLARLALKPEEVALYQGQLVRILESMDELSKLDTAKVEPMTSVGGQNNVWREDEPRKFEKTESLLANAPDREGPYFKVPKVIAQ